MANVLDDEHEGPFLVLANEDGQHSLWPAATAAPKGWSRVHGPAERKDCLAYIEEFWLELRPAEGRATAPRYGGVHGLVSARAAISPDAVAVAFGESTLTYRELDELSDGYSRWLTRAGAVGVVVPILMARSAELIAMLLGVLKAGSAYLFLDPEDPQARQFQLIRVSGARFLVVDAGAVTPPSDGVQVLVDPGRDAAAFDRGSVGAMITPETAAYVCYTSGSTGEPRGVLVPHRAITRLVQSPSWISVGADDVILQCAPISFDASTFEIWTALANGCRLVVYPAGRIELTELAEVLRAESVSVLWLTAGLFHRMAAGHVRAFAGLRVLLAGGDVVSPAHVSAILAAHPGLTFINGYGPTENTTFTACWPTREVPGTGPLPIGRPIDGTRVEVLDENLEPVAVASVGELWASGEGLALGYLGDPAATAERFVAHPRAARPGARMYRTGDLARWREDGGLDFLGRADGQVKVNGFRVDTTALEYEIQEHSLTTGAAVVSQTAESGDARLIAYVTRADAALDSSAADTVDHSAFAAELRRWLGSRLPAYCVPWAVRVLPELPLTASGKVDRRALPAATLQPRNVWNDYVMPGDELESVLAEAWGKALGIEPVGVEDDFFDLGGHSLLAADLIGLLHRDYEIDLSARMLYMQPTIAAIADSLRTKSAIDPRTEKAHVSGP